jgi:hypothetical protein
VRSVDVTFQAAPERAAERLAEDLAGTHLVTPRNPF